MQDWWKKHDERGFIWPIRPIWFNQTNETDQINKRDQSVLQSRRAPCYFFCLARASASAMAIVPAGCG